MWGHSSVRVIMSGGKPLLGRTCAEAILWVGNPVKGQFCEGAILWGYSLEEAIPPGAITLGSVDSVPWGQSRFHSIIWFLSSKVPSYSIISLYSLGKGSLKKTSGFFSDPRGGGERSDLIPDFFFNNFFKCSEGSRKSIKQCHHVGGGMYNNF